MQKTLQSRINMKEKAKIKVETRERRDTKRHVKRGRKEGETAAGSDDSVERKQPPRRRVVSAKTDEVSAAKDGNKTGKTNPKTVKDTRAATEPQREKEPVQRGRGIPQQLRRRVRKAAVSSSSMLQTEAEGADPNAGLRRSKRIASRK